MAMEKHAYGDLDYGEILKYHAPAVKQSGAQLAGI
jgi:hypothetical protein